MKIAIDVSYYNNLSAAQWDLLATVLDGVIIRLSYGLNVDVMADDHIDQANRVGLPFAGYHWADPTLPINAQLSNVLACIEKFKPASMFNDYEQYWSNWPAYMRSDWAAVAASKIAPTTLNNYYLKFDTSLKSTSPVPIGRYSAEWFINSWCPALGLWVTKENYWEARYMRYYNAAYLYNKRKELGIPFDIQNIKELAANAPIVKGIGRQFESYLEVKGLYENIRYHLDWNVFKDEAFATLFKTTYTPPVDIPEEIPPAVIIKYKVINTPWVNVRDVPNGSIIGGRMGGSIVEVNLVNGLPEIMYGWAHILPMGWIYTKYLAEVK